MFGFLKNVMGLFIPTALSRDELLKAIRNNDKKTVESLAQIGANIEAADIDSDKTLLQEALAHADIEMVALLLKKGAKMGAINNYGETALYHAALYGGNNTAIVECLLRSGADIKAANKFGETPLHAAASYNNPKIVELLLQKDPNIEATNKDGNTALHLAVRHGCTTIVELLLQKGANIKAANKDGDTALHIAAVYDFAALDGRAKIVELLVQKGADLEAVNNNADTALHLAVLHNHTEVIEALLKNQTEVKKQKLFHQINNLEKNAITIAHEGNDCVELVPLLQKHGAALPKNLCTFEGISKLFPSYLGRSIPNNDNDAVHNDFDELMEAASYGQDEKVKSLVKKGANVKAANEQGETVLHYAAENCKAETVKYLIKKGADVHAVDSDGETALHYAARNGDPAVVKLLLENGADINATNRLEQTALHTAASCNKPEVVKLLLEINAKDDIPDYHFTTLQMAPCYLPSRLIPADTVKSRKHSLPSEAAANTSEEQTAFKRARQ